MAIRRTVELTDTPWRRRVEPTRLKGDGGARDGETAVEGSVHDHDGRGRDKWATRDGTAALISRREDNKGCIIPALRIL